MPIYEYKCLNCGESFEFMQKVTEPKKTTCPKCKTETLQKALTTASFKISGNGVYSPGFSSNKE